MPDQQPKRAVLFLRARWLGHNGHDRATEDRQIALQRQACETAAEQLGAKLIREYAEHGGTGPIRQRPLLRQMLDELLAMRGVDYVICVGLERLARSRADMAAIQLELEAAGAELVVADGTQALPAGHQGINGNRSLITK